MSRPMWFVALIKKAFPTRFAISRLAKNVPFVGRIVHHILFRGDDIIYLPKDNVIQIRQPISQAEETVLPSQVVEHFIEQANYLWIMDKCICRDADQCEDYPIDLGCLFLGEAVLNINPQLGRLVTKAQARAHLRRAREAGLVHLIGRNRLDSVWMGANPHDKLLTICNCCPCCCLWRVLPDLPPEISRNVTKMPGVSVTINDDCVGCGVCTQEVCFVDAIRLADGHAVIDDAACRGCGRCVDVCPQQAIKLTVENTTFVDLSVARIAPLVDVA